VPPAVAAVVGRCLEKDPDRRYQRAGEVRSALEAVQSGAALPELVRHTAGPSRWWLAAAVAFAAAIAAIVALDLGSLRTWVMAGISGPQPSIKLAVLPFANLSGDPEQEYLSDGLTQELIAQLGRLHPQALSVIARTSVMRYKKSDAPVDQIGRELGVEYVLEGSARREADRIRVTAELIHVRDQTQLWADSYERELSGILALQSDVARQVAGALALKLLPAEQTRLTSARTVNPEAYEAYLKGSYHWQKLTPTDIDTAERYFELALERDPSFAPAYEGLAWVWAARQQTRISPPSEAGPKAKAFALRAVELDEDCAGAHEALAMVRSWTDWDWAGAEPEWQRALTLNPNAANTHAYYAHFLANTGRAAEAIPHAERALELDPFNALYRGMYGIVLLFNRRYDDAIAAGRAGLDLQPGLGPAVGALEQGLIAKGMREEHLALQRNLVAEDPERLALFERSLAESGYIGVQRAFAEYRAAAYRKSTSKVGARGIANRYLAAGEYEHAMRWLEESYEEHDPNLAYLGLPLYDPVRTDPRFRALLRRIGLPEG
jgi:TolB-like protein